jgi:hypothetical protein
MHKKPLQTAMHCQDTTLKLGLENPDRDLFYLKTDNAAAGNTGQKTATNVYPVKNKQSCVQY